MSKIRSLFLLSAILMLTLNAKAVTFRNAYIAFEMQDNWSCQLEQTEWVCRSSDPVEAKEAVIILTAKEKGVTDRFHFYENHLNNPIATVTRGGESLTSILKYKAVTNKVNDQNWLDGLHQNSEVKHYFTRYLATVKENMAILVTFSAHNRHYAKHSANFNRTIQKLRISDLKPLTELRPEPGEIWHTHGGDESRTVASANDEITKRNSIVHGIWIALVALTVAGLSFVAFRVWQRRGRRG